MIHTASVLDPASLKSSVAVEAGSDTTALFTSPSKSVSHPRMGMGWGGEMLLQLGQQTWDGKREKPLQTGSFFILRST